MRKLYFLLLILIFIINISWHPYYPKVGKHGMKGDVRLVIKPVEHAGKTSLSVEEYNRAGFIKEIRLYDLTSNIFFIDRKLQFDSIERYDTSELILEQRFCYTYSNSNKLKSFERIHYDNIVNDSLHFIQEQNNGITQINKEPQLRKDLKYPYFKESFKSKLTNYYDIKDSLIATSQIKYYNDTINLDSSKFIYILDNNVVSKITLSNNKDTVSIEEYYLGENNNIEQIISGFESETDCIFTTDILYYKDNKLGLLIEESTPKDIISNCEAKTINYIYNDNDLLIRKIIQIENYKGADTKLFVDYNYNYNSSGRLISQSFIKMEDYIIDVLSSSIYNKHGDVSYTEARSYYKTDVFNEIVDIWEFDYEYDSMNNWIMKNTMSKTGASGIERRKIYYYE